MLIPNVAHSTVIKVPDEVDLKDAVLYDVVCVALHGVKKSDFRFGDNVVVSGTGPIGLSAIALLKAAGANKIVALGTSPEKYDRLKKYGADYCLNPKTTENLKEELCKIFGSDVPCILSRSFP